MTARRHLRIRGPQLLGAVAIALALVAGTSDDVYTQIGTTIPSWVGSYSASGGGGLLSIGTTLLTPDRLRSTPAGRVLRSLSLTMTPNN